MGETIHETTINLMLYKDELCEIAVGKPLLKKSVSDISRKKECEDMCTAQSH